MVKHHIWIIAFFLSIGVLGKAANTARPEDNQPISAAVCNSLYYNYSKVQGNFESEERTNLSDDFNLPFLRPDWLTQSKTSLWTLKERPGYLRLKSDRKRNVNKLINHSFAKAINLNQDGEAVSLIELSNCKESDESGLYLKTDEVQFIQVETINGIQHLEAQIGNKHFSGASFNGTQVIFKLQVQRGIAWFEYSTDGLAFQPFGQPFALNATNSQQMGSVGLFCLNKKGNGGTIDVDWFYLSQDNPAIQYTEVITTIN